MKERLIGFVKIYVFFVVVFVLQKPLFMFYYHSLFADVSWADYFRVMWHGLPLDFSLTGYLTLLPGLLLIVSAWTLSRALRWVWNGYFLLVSVLLSVIFVTDMALYEYWGFRLDATPLFYFFSSPRDAVASVSGWFVACGLLVAVGYAALLYKLFHVVLLRKKNYWRVRIPYRRVSVSLVLLLLTGLLFIPIRGGFSVSTMNTGKVYFSDNQRLNHAATNPAFNLMESLSKQKDFAAQYRYMEADEAARLFASQLDEQVLDMKAGGAGTDSLLTGAVLADTLFTTSRPDIVFVILESFSSHLLPTQGGQSDVAPNLDSLANAGVLFTNFYANSFRTDRGLVSILSGYPAQPTTSIMKYPRKTQHLPSIAGKLRQAGYGAHYYYGGDADFTNMRSYLMSSGFESIVADHDFPVSERLSKWGVHDHLVFARLLADLEAETLDADADRKPQFRVLQTSSSHEPFEVPYQRLDNPRLNAFAYTDSCLGDFVRRFSRLPQWKHTLLVLVPDHLGAYPENLGNLVKERYHIPLVLAGGAVRHQGRRIDVYGSQQDLAATLLAQLGLSHGEFTFSKDMLHPSSPHFAYFTFPDAFGRLTDSTQVIFDNQAGRLVICEGPDAELDLQNGKAYLQKLYDDIANK